MRRLKKVLVIDKSIDKVLTEMTLLESGFTEQVAIVDDCLEARKYLRENCTKDISTCPEIIIIDSDFPITDAKEFVKSLRNLKSEIHEDLFLVTLTADTKEEDIQFLKNDGVENLIFKPLTEEKLKNIISGYLNKL